MVGAQLPMREARITWSCRYQAEKAGFGCVLGIEEFRRYCFGAGDKVNQVESD
ncbi:hypothetical protein HanRHA438_Chr04g0151831 [Helianthus annuus]|nr:hypothetical protein HanRHA438_Chr04g0151831 [Helianthus annuus]